MDLHEGGHKVNGQKRQPKPQGNFQLAFPGVLRYTNQLKCCIWSLAIAALFCVASSALACTTILVGKNATVDGSVMVAHCDDGLGDGSMVYVPAMDHPKGAKRPVYYAQYALDFDPKWGATIAHRLACKGRGPVYDRTDVPASVPIGYIPEVPHTYAYFDGSYGIVNEYQLAMGEDTDKAKVQPDAVAGKRLFYSSELSRVALERCKTAREAIKLMGYLIKTYGYYGTGETLLVADPQEAWVMEMAAYDEKDPGGVWVAERIPDDSFYVSANQFRIRDVVKGNPNMMYSSNIFSVAQKKGWWKPSDGPLDFARVYGNGERKYPYHALRRVWRAESLVAPSLNLPAWVDGPFTRAYPFTVKPDKKLSVQDLFKIYRDHYEGTEFDLTKGIAAGPFGNPSRLDGSSPNVKGHFERAIDVIDCGYTYVVQCRSWLPNEVGGVTWYGANRPGTSVFMPFYVGANTLPECIQKADLLKLDRGSMWTAMNFVDNYSMLRYCDMIKDIQTVQSKFEQRFFSDQPKVEEQALTLLKNGDRQGAKDLLTHYSDSIASDVLSQWWTLADSLYVKYDDGYITTPEEIGQEAFYPDWWLKATDYQKWNKTNGYAPPEQSSN